MHYVITYYNTQVERSDKTFVAFDAKSALGCLAYCFNGLTDEEFKAITLNHTVLRGEQQEEVLIMRKCDCDDISRHPKVTIFKTP